MTVRPRSLWLCVGDLRVDTLALAGGPGPFASFALYDGGGRVPVPNPPDHTV